METLTSRQRMAHALRGEPTDRPGVAYLFLGGARHVLGAVGQSMRTVYADPELMASAQITAAELFGHDSSMLPWGCLTVEAEAFGCQLELHEHFYPQVLTRPLENQSDLSLLSDLDPASSGRMPLVLEGLTRLRARAGDDSFVVAMVVSPFLVATELRGMTALFMDFISDPPFVEALMERVTDGIARYVQAILRSGSCDAIMFENAGATRDLVGPHHVTQYITPYHRRLLAVARREDPDALLIEHNCSETPYFEEILSSDIDAVSFAHGNIQACRQIARIGNVDHSQTVLNGTPEDVFAEARAVIENARGAPFCLSTGCEIPFKAPIENIQALAHAAQAGF